MFNIPVVKPCILAVSRDCFPVELSRKRREAVVKAYRQTGADITECETVVENENDVLKVLEEIGKTEANAMVIYLGNFGPEGPETILARKFPGPVMFAAAAETSGNSLMDERGDAYCGMLNASYNMGLRHINPYMPEYPVGTPEDVAEMIGEFIPVARIILGVSRLKIFGFGPRPQDFFACNAPINPLYQLGAEVMENSELDLLAAFKEHENDGRIPELVADMKSELGGENRYAGILVKLAQYELTLYDWYDTHRGVSEYAVFANKCWPSFKDFFGFVPCYVNSRMAANGVPVACEVDIYGALSEYMLECATGTQVTLLDINNTVPLDMYHANKDIIGNYKTEDLFMGFHCGNTPKCYLKNASLKYQLIMQRSIEDGKEPDLTRGTLEGTIKPGNVTLFRLQGSMEGILKSYIAQGEVLDIGPESFGCIGVFAVKEMARFYRYVLIEGRFPHHAAVGFEHIGKTLYSALKMLGINDIKFNQPEQMLYKDENPFKRFHNIPTQA